MTLKSSIKGHFDGRSIVLDEPASLVVGQEVRILVDPMPATDPIQPAFTPLVDITGTLMNGDTWDESAVIHIDPLDAVPANFVRRPGSAAGQIEMADDFAATPAEFKEYL